MYNIIPLILILISLTIIITIVVRKFSVLANLDVENIPKEKEAKFKEQIISGRLKRNITKWGSKMTRFIKPIFEAISSFFKFLYNKLHDLKDNYKTEEVLPKEEAKKKADYLLVDVDELIKNEEFEIAEKKLLEIINLDNKNIESFRTLGKLYYERKNYEEAKETFEHVLKLTPADNAEINFDLSLVYKEMEINNKALEYIKKALKLEPNNPRYLDTGLQISIIENDKENSLDFFQRLQESNPENQKLTEFKEQIDEL